MSNSDDSGAFIFYLLFMVIAVMVVTAIAALMAGGGVFIGGYEAIKNYLQSFHKNVKLETVPSTTT